MVKQLVKQDHIGVRRLGQGLLARPFVRHVSFLTLANGVGAALAILIVQEGSRIVREYLDSQKESLERVCQAIYKLVGDAS